MKRLLALSWCMPPIVMPRSIQVSRLLASLTDFDWQVDVVCVDHTSLRPERIILDDSFNRPANGRVKKYPVPSLEDWILVRGLIRIFPAIAYLPDTRYVWKNAAFRKCDLLAASTKYDAFISFAQPWTDHLAGLQFAENNHLPWVAHFSDPWADSPFLLNSRFVKNTCLDIEEAVIGRADAVIFVTQQTSDLVMKKYPQEWQKKVHVIPHGFEPDDASFTSEKEASIPLEFVYTGNFYGHRKPDSLLEAAQKLAAEPAYKGTFKISFVGPISEEYRQKVQHMGLSDTVLFEGPVSFSASQDFCRKADVLLVIDAPSESTSVFLPSKLVDYLAFNKPILGLTPASGGSADLIEQLGCQTVRPDDVSGIAGQLARLIDDHLSGRLSLPDKFAQTAARYHINHAAESLNQLLTSLI